MVKLEEVAKIDNKAVSPDEMRGELQNYIGLENIESNTGQLVSFSETLGDDIKSNKFGFTEEHILYGKLRPYLNKVYLPDFAGVCSTDIIPIKPDSDLLIREFLGYFLRTPEFVSMINAKSSGANLPRVNPKTLLDVYIPLPPIETQYKIVAILEKTEATQRLRAEADFQGHKLIYNAFNGFFGDFDENPHGWEIVELRDIVREKITDGVHKTPKYCEDGVPFISANNIKNNQIDFTRCKKISTEEHELLARRCNPENDDILLSKVGTLGMVAKVDNDNFSIFVQLALIKPNKKLINSNFLKYALLTNSLQKQIQSYANMSTMKYIGVGKIGLLKIVLPPISIQESFSSIVERVEKIQDGQQKSKNEVNTLFSGLMIRAFTGELVA